MNKKMMTGWGVLTALATLCGCSSPEQSVTISEAPFGVTAGGEKVMLYTLKGVGGLKLEVTDFGGKVVRCWAPDKNGKFADVTLGWNTVAEYEKNGFSMGTIIGRFGNRIADGKFALDGKTYQLAINENTPTRHCNLHAGPKGWDSKVWKARPFMDGSEQNVPALELTLVSPDGDMGFPGMVICKVTYRVLPNNTWKIDYEATTDKPTVLNLTHHSYWNLAGEASGCVNDQLLKIEADEFLATTPGLIPTQAMKVDGTGFDFRELRPIGAKADWMAKSEVTKFTDGWYDHCFILRGKNGALKPCATMKDPASGRKLEIFTTEPGMQMYGAQNMKGNMNAKEAGKKLVKCAGIALETQHYPDSPNRKDFPTTVLRPGEIFRSTTEYRFSAE